MSENRKITLFLIGISVFMSLWYFLNPSLGTFSAHSGYLAAGDYIGLLIQIFVSKFLHGDLLHLMFNMIFLFYFGTRIEEEFGGMKLLGIFIIYSIISFFLYINLTAASSIGMSGFILAIAVLYSAMLKEVNNPEYKGLITFILIMGVLGLSPGVSFLSHLIGIGFGCIMATFYLVYHRQKKKKMY